jgi:prophage regulatory protein
MSVCVTPTEGGKKVLRMPQLLERISLSRAATYDRLNPKSRRYDATFPRPIRLGLNSVGWLESEVDAWIAKQADRREQGGEVGGAQ